MAKPRLQVEICPNQHCRLYHTNFKMVEERVGQILDGIMFEDEKKKIEASSEAVKKLVYGIQGIPGILNFNFTEYKLQVVKAPLFDWSEIEPQITGLIQMGGAEIVGEEIELVEKPIWEFQKWGLNADGTKRRRGFLEDVFDED
jgi:hypothetical protein